MKANRILTFLLTGLCLGSLVACGGNQGEENVQPKGVTPVAEQQAPFQSLYYVQSFDNYLDMYNCGFVDFYGKVELSNEHAVTGTSARVELQFPGAFRGNPYMLMNMKRMEENRGDYGYDYSDLSMIDYIGFYVYNDNDFEGTLNFVLSSSAGNVFNNFYKIAPHSGQNVRLKVDRAAMKLMDAQAQNLYFYFDSVANSVWYFDDVYVEKALDPIEVKERTFDSNDLLNFNNAEDVNYVVRDSVLASTAHIVTHSIVSDPGIVKDAGALKLNFARMLEPDGDFTIHPKYYYSGITLTKLFYDGFNFEKLWTKDFCVDVFSAANKPMTFILRITDGVGTSFDKKFVVAPNQWATLKLNFNDCGEDTTLRLDTISKVSVYVNYQELDGDSVDFYFDNFRLEDIAI